MLFADHRSRSLGDRFRKFLDGIELGDLCLRLGNRGRSPLKLLVRRGLSRSLEKRTQRRAVPARQVALGIAEGLQVGNPDVAAEIGGHWRVLTVATVNPPFVNRACVFPSAVTREVAIC